MIVQWDSEGLIDPGPSRRGSHHTTQLNLCPRKAAAMKQLGLDGGSAATSLGGLFHCGIAHAVAERFKLGTPDNKPLGSTAAMEAYRKRHGVKTGPTEDQWLLDSILESLSAIDNEYPGWKPVGIEREVEARVFPHADWTWAQWIHPFGVLHTQRIDLALESLGLIWFVDWKTTYQINQRTLVGHHLNLQMLSMAYLGYKMYGPKFGGVAAVRVQKGKLRISVDPMPGASFAIEDVPLNICWGATVERTFEGREWREHPPVFAEAACIGAYGPQFRCPVWDTCAHGVVGL